MQRIKTIYGNVCICARDPGTDTYVPINFSQFLLRTHIVENFHTKGCFYCFFQVSLFYAKSELQDNE